MDVLQEEPANAFIFSAAISSLAEVRGEDVFLLMTFFGRFDGIVLVEVGWGMLLNHFF